jgi:hypothetical protein
VAGEPSAVAIAIENYVHHDDCDDDDDDDEK